MAALALAAAMSGCAPSIPREALQLTPQSVENRRIQTRLFDTGDEAQLLSASAALLQDLGFTLDESEIDLGLIVASKDRDAREVGQIAYSVFVTALTLKHVPYDRRQHIRASVVTYRPDGRKGFAVRLTMQRIVWDTKDEISRAEALNEAEIYQTFFDKLSKSVFLEAQQL